MRSKLQETEFAILKQVVEICEANKIEYYAFYGTLLGAIREGGIVPWDDDIDIAIPRKDYDRFVALAKSKLPTHLLVETYKDQSSSSHPIYICQVKDTNTSVVLRYSSVPQYTHAWVDVFPLDALPANPILRYVHEYRLLIKRMLIQMSMFEENTHMFRKNRPLHERFLIALCEKTKLGSTMDTQKLMRSMEKCLLRYQETENGYFISMFGAYKLKEAFPISWFRDAEKVSFEDFEIAVPSNASGILSRMYGDYMTPPPVEEQNIQHCIEIVQV